MIEAVVLLPVHISQGQRPLVVLRGFGDQGHVSIGQVRVASGRGNSTGGGTVAGRLGFNAGGIQRQQAGIAVLCGDFPGGRKLGQDFLHIFAVALQSNGLRMGLRLAFHVILPGHIQQGIKNAFPFKVSGGDGGGVLPGVQYIDFFQPRAISVSMLHDLRGIKGG